jgi:hypothetical protein
VKLQPLLHEEHEEPDEDTQLIELTELEDGVDEDVLYDAFMTAEPERDLRFYGHDLRDLCQWSKMANAFKRWKGTTARSCKITGLFYIPESKELRVLGEIYIGPPASPQWFHFLYDKGNVNSVASAIASPDKPASANTVDMRKFIDQLHLN